VISFLTPRRGALKKKTGPGAVLPGLVASRNDCPCDEVSTLPLSEMPSSYQNPGAGLLNATRFRAYRRQTGSDPETGFEAVERISNEFGLWNVIERFAMSIVGFLRYRQADILVANGESLKLRRVATIS
jgi:hypothetical protein